MVEGEDEGIPAKKPTQFPPPTQKKKEKKRKFWVLEGSGGNPDAEERGDNPRSAVTHNSTLENPLENPLEMEPNSPTHTETHTHTHFLGLGCCDCFVVGLFGGGQKKKEGCSMIFLLLLFFFRNVRHCGGARSTGTGPPGRLRAAAAGAEGRRRRGPCGAPHQKRSGFCDSGAASLRFPFVIVD